MDKTNRDPVNPKYEETNIDEVEEIKEPDIVEDTKIERKPDAAKTSGVESQNDVDESPTEEQGAAATGNSENVENGLPEINEDTEAKNGKYCRCAL